MGSVSVAACLAEFFAMTLFVAFSCGTAMGVAATYDASLVPGWVLLVALTFGLSITALVYATAHHTVGHVNCAVTFGLVLTGQCAPAQGIANLIAQMLGSTFGAAILFVMYPKAKDQTGGLGSNGLAQGWEWHNALVGEILGTFLLMMVVLQTAVQPKSAGNRAQAAIAIGLAVFVAHAVLLPIDGCSINPTRSFGPALIAHIRTAGSVPTFRHMWIFWVGPLVGAALAAGHYRVMEMVTAEEESHGGLRGTKSSSQSSQAVDVPAEPNV